MNNIEEKISALYDGELSETEAEEILLRIELIKSSTEENMTKSLKIHYAL